MVAPVAMAQALERPGEPPAADGPAERAELLARAFAALLGEVILWDTAGRVVLASAGALRRLGLVPLDGSGQRRRLPGRSDM